MDDILINKLASIERCLNRIKVDYKEDFRTNYTRQDAVLLNIERIVQSCIDISTHLIRKNKFGLPQTSREVFDILAQNSLIDQDLNMSLQKMVGFRNIAIHEYKRLNLDIVESIIKKEFDDVQRFCQIVHKIAYTLE